MIPSDIVTMLQKTTEQEVAKHNERAAEYSRQLDSMTTQRDALLAERDVTAQQIVDVSAGYTCSRLVHLLKL